MKVKNWSDFQHYKHRCPPWIKLHHNLLDDYEFHCLPVASRAIAPLLWLLASESPDGRFPGDVEKISFRLHLTHSELINAIKPLIIKGFFEWEQGDSEALAACLQDADSETETELETELEAEVHKPKPARTFKPPTLEEVTLYCKERQNHVDPEKWLAYYTSNGFKVGRAAMKDWRAAVITWEKNGFSKGGNENGRKQETFGQIAVSNTRRAAEAVLARSGIPPESGFAFDVQPGADRAGLRTVAENTLALPAKRH